MLWILGIIVLLILVIIGMYNNLVQLRLKVKNSWSQIDVQLQRRFDLIPNLVETIKGYAKHEKQTLEDVVKARNTFVAATTPEAEMEADGELTKMVSKLMMLTENYPELKANENFLSLQADLRQCEDKISIMRQFYNDTVLKYNNKVQTVPTNIVAAKFNFTTEKFFETTGEDREAPKVSFE